METVLKIVGLSKKFGAHAALENIHMEVGTGEIIGILGANGSGKSTLFHILAGSQHIQETGGFSGEIHFQGKPYEPVSENHAQSQGIGLVHQELSLFNEMDAVTNITLNREHHRPSYRLDHKRNKDQASDVLGRLGIEMELEVPLKKVPMALRQFVEIGREMSRSGLKLLLLDEPTSSLDAHAAQSLLDSMEQIRRSGTSIIFVSHRLEEITAVCDRIIILRDGRVVSVINKGDYDIARMAQDMVGGEIALATRQRQDMKESIHLEFSITSAHDGHRCYSGLNLTVNAGEIIGVTGLAGHGQGVFSDILAGSASYEGQVLLDGKSLDMKHACVGLDKGIVVLLEDRKGKSLLLERSVEDNITFTARHGKKAYRLLPWLGVMSLPHHDAMRRDALTLIGNQMIKCTSPMQKVKELSGGNQQKVCFARAILADPKVLIVGEPTRGIDIQSKELVLNMLVDLNMKKGTTIIVSSGELDELRRVCDRVVVMYEGGIATILDADSPKEAFAMAIVGQSPVDAIDPLEARGQVEGCSLVQGGSHEIRQ